MIEDRASLGLKKGVPGRSLMAGDATELTGEVANVFLGEALRGQEE